MNAIHSKSSYLYDQIRRALRSGRYVPGQRIDPGTVAAEYRTSLTPVRFALYRLVGDGMLSDHARAGFHVPMPTEMGMRDLYDWMERLLIMACETSATKSQARSTPAPVFDSDDVPKKTWRLFDAIAREAGHSCLHQAVRHANDRLAPVRRAKQDLIDHAAEELADIEQVWRAHDTARLSSALRAYHERRKQLVPCIVASLTERVSQLH